MDSSTQRDRIKQILWDRFEQWVPLPEILPLAAQYSARICELRKELRPKGYEIENKRERQPNGSTHSWFRVCYSKPVDITPKSRTPVQHAPIANGDWFEKRFGARPASTNTAPKAGLPLFTVHT